MDSSRAIYGAVLYVENVRLNEMFLVSAKNRLINSKLVGKSIPCLELQSVLLGTELIIDTFNELCGEDAVEPLNICDLTLYSDSSSALRWLHSFSNKFDKMNNKSIFVLNRLEAIHKFCDNRPICFKFCPGLQNPADCITRCLSRKQLLKSSYFSGPMTKTLNDDVVEEFTVPCPMLNQLTSSIQTNNLFNSNKTKYSHLIDIRTFSKFRRVLRVYAGVMCCAKKWQHKTFRKETLIGEESYSVVDFSDKAATLFIIADQREHLADIVQYFDGNLKSKKHIPDLVTQLNVFKDTDGILRVKY